MEIENLYIDEILFNLENKPIVNTIVIEFSTPTWVSAHREREGERVEPFVLLNSKKELENNESIKRHLGIRKLKYESKKKMKIHYNDTWTFKPKSIFSIVLPEGFVFKNLSIELFENNEQLNNKIGITKENKIFYYTLLGYDYNSFELNISSIIEKNEKEYNQLSRSNEVADGTKIYGDFRKIIRNKEISSDLWLKLLEIGKDFLK